MTFILGRKVKMTQVWKDDRVVPVTVVHAAPNRVTLVRTTKRDGYEAAQLSLGRARREGRGATELAAGNEVTVSAFAEGDRVKVSGVSIGRGFQGVVKRHGFHGGPKTHGQKDRHRAPGSIGSTAPQRVVPGRRMPGRMGGTRVTVKNLRVVAVDAAKNILMLSGAVPGARGGLVEISKLRSQNERS